MLKKYSLLWVLYITKGNLTNSVNIANFYVFGPLSASESSTDHKTTFPSVKRKGNYIFQTTCVLQSTVFSFYKTKVAGREEIILKKDKWRFDLFKVTCNAE